jgi:transposase-like protein
MTPKQLERIGKAVYGEKWAVAIARDLGVSRQTIYYWLKNKHPMPTDGRFSLINQRLKKILEKKKKDVDLLLNVLYLDDK